MTAAFSVAVSFIYFDVRCERIRRYIGSEHTVTAVVSGIESENLYSGSYVITVREIDGKNKKFKAVLDLDFGGDLGDGDLIRFTGEASAPENENRYFDYKAYNSSRGIDVIFTVSDVSGLDLVGFGAGGPAGWIRSLNRRIGRIFYRYFDDDARGLLSALLLGDRSGLSPSVRRDFTRAGIPHMLAVSGMHLSVIAAMLTGLLSALKCPVKLRRFLLFVFIGFYMFLTGMHISVVRASLMFFMTLAGEAFMSRNDPATALFLSAAAIVTFSPCSIADTGFLLSFSTTLGIVTMGKAVSSRIKTGVFGSRLLSAAGRAASGAAVTLAAVLFSLPIVWAVFGKISLVSPISNLLFAYPVTVMICLAALLAAVSFVPPAAAAIAVPLNGLTHAVIDGTSRLSRIKGVMLPLNYPFTVYIAGAALCVLAVLVILKRDSLKTAAAVVLGSAAVFVCAALAYEAGYADTARIVYQPVGKNDVICAEASGVTAVTDISDGSRATRQYFEGIIDEYFHRSEIDIYMITHWHAKTPSAVSSLLERCFVGRLLLPEPCDEASLSAAEKVEKIVRGSGTEIVYYPSQEDTVMDIGGLRIETAALGKLGRSEHPTTALKFGFGSGALMYAGASAYDTSQYEIIERWRGECSAAIFGAHGPKSEYPPLIPEGGGCLTSAAVWEGFAWAGDLGDILGVRVITASDGKPVYFVIKNRP